MKRLLFALLLLPQLAFAQYHAACFNLETNRHATVTTVGSTFTSDTTLTLGVRSEITGLSVSGRATLNSEDGYIRILLKDSYNYEYLVYENHLLLADSTNEDFQNIAIETQWLEKITPQAIRIETHHATLLLSSYRYITASSGNRMTSVSLASIEMAQRQYIINKLNGNLLRLNIPWRAGITSVSEMSYEDRKSMFGGKMPQLYGLEHYVGGIFVMPGYVNRTTRQTKDSINRTGSLVSEWDWRNRHGKNWMTPVKHQSLCGACWIFGSVATLEAYINLYFNRLINYDLSEEDVLSCNHYDKNCDNGGTMIQSLNHIRNYGIVEEDCFPYSYTVQDCGNKCQNPTEMIFINDFVVCDSTEDALKRALFTAPLVFDNNSWRHVFCIAGYTTLQAGNQYYIWHGSTDDTITINNNSPLLGQTAWIIKNSWGSNWGDNGYFYGIFNLYDSHHYPARPDSGITSQIYTDADIVCDDEDGDGYYFWGIGPRPSNFPSWLPQESDGDDSNYTKGTLDSYGNLEENNPDLNPFYTVSGNEVFSSRTKFYKYITIPSNATLTVENVLNIIGWHSITIQSGGELIIDGGVITNGHIQMSSGSKLTIRNGGKLVISPLFEFSPPVGAIVNVENGEILPYNAF